MTGTDAVTGTGTDLSRGRPDSEGRTGSRSGSPAAAEAAALGVRGEPRPFSPAARCLSAASFRWGRTRAGVRVKGSPSGFEARSGSE